MRLVVERLVGDLEIAENRSGFLAMVWERMRNEVALQLMEHLESGLCRVEVLRYTDDDPENRRKRLKYVVLINELPQMAEFAFMPENRPTASVLEWSPPRYAIASQVFREVPLARMPESAEDTIIPPPEPTDDWI